MEILFIILMIIFLIIVICLIKRLIDKNNNIESFMNEEELSAEEAENELNDK